MKWFVIILVCFATIYGQGRYLHVPYWDVGVTMGSANCLGEIGGDINSRRNWLFDLDHEHFEASVAGFTRFNPAPWYAIRTQFQWARVSGEDANAENPARRIRNLHFRNDVFSLSTRFEWNFFVLYKNNKRRLRQLGNHNLFMNVYLGVGLMYHNPKALYAKNGVYQDLAGEWIALRKYQTEGVKYSNWVFEIPYGINIFYEYNREWRFGIDISISHPFTDYIDDVSTNYKAMSEKNLSGRDLIISNEMMIRADELSEQEINAVENGANIKSYHDVPHQRGGEDYVDNIFYVHLMVAYRLPDARHTFDRKRRYGPSKKRRNRKKFRRKVRRKRR